MEPKLKSHLSQMITSQNDKNFFNRIWDTDEKVYENRLRAIGFDGMQNVLDAGSGFGQWSCAIAKMNKNVIGVEISEERTSVAKEIAKAFCISNLTFEIGDIANLRFKDNFFDAIFCYSTIYFTDYIKVINEFYRVIKTGGLLYINTNDLGWYLCNFENEHNPSEDFSPRKMAAESIYNTFNYLSRGKFKAGTPIVMPKSIFMKQLEDAGFKIEQHGDDGSISVNNDIKSDKFFIGNYKGVNAVYEISCRKC